MNRLRSPWGVVVLALLAAGGGMVAALTPPPSERTVAWARTAGARAAADTFPHDRHEALACLKCHLTEEGHGDLTFEPPRGCAACHHRDPPANDCTVCHAPDDLAAPYPHTFAVTIEDHDPRYRTVGFSHVVHAERQCIDCHREPVTLVPDSASATCQACHEDHHGTATRCALCHRTWPVLDAHTVTEGHADCDQCHTPATIALLVPERSYCLVCHDDDVDHYQGKACTVCHLQDDPKDYQRQLIGPTR